MSLPGKDSNASGLVSQAADALLRALEQIRTIPVQDSMRPLYVQGVVLELMASLLDLIGSESIGLTCPTPIDEHRCVGAARDILMNNLTNPPSIEDLARQVGLSQRRLNEVFRQTFGAAPYQCLKNWRLEQARILLKRGDMTVKQVSHQMGYAHVSSFTHAYTHCFGKSPSQDALSGNPSTDRGDSRHEI